MKEVLLKFETAEQASEWMRWFSEYGQYEERLNPVLAESIDFDFENNIINL